MASQKRLPTLLGKEPEIKLNEKEIAEKIQSNFHNYESKSHINLRYSIISVFN